MADGAVTAAKLAAGVGSLTTKLLRARYFNSGTSYTPASDVAAFYVQVYGATGGVSGGNLAGVGGSGYSEKYYASPSGSYSYGIGAAGSALGTAGGSTTFGGVITVTGSGGVTTATGSAGGVGSGGDFNASGGVGGNRTSSYGGCGGPGSRAGNGGAGGNDGGATGQGGTGGNAASGIIAGAAASAPSGSAIVMPWGNTNEQFLGGNTLSSPGGFGCAGCPILNNSDASLIGYVAYGFPFTGAQGMLVPAINPAGLGVIPYPVARNVNGASAGFSGLIVIIEVLK